MKFICAGDFADTVLKDLNQLRKEQILCDVTLIISKQKIHAHRCVLAVNSPYFKGMFAGCFVESSLREIDLTEVSFNVKAFETVIDYMYTGGIEIDCIHFGDVLKLSFFFLMQDLQQLCISYMESSLTLVSSVEYYVYAAAYNLLEIQEKTAPFLRLRFHDFIISNTGSLLLLLSPADLLYLVKKDFIQYCSTFQILEFVLRWVKTGRTQEFIDVAMYILELCSEEVDIDTEIEFNLIQKGCDQLERVKFYEKIVQKIKTFLEKAKGIKSLKKTQGQLSREEFEFERVLITLSPSPTLLENYIKNEIFKDACDSLVPTENKAFLDICAYAPESKTWYHLAKLYECQHVPKFLTDFIEVPFQMIVYQDSIGFLRPYHDKLYLYNCYENIWRIVDTTNVDLELYDLVPEKQHRTFVVGQNGRIYLLVGMRMTLQDNDLSLNFTEVVYCCFVLEDDGMTWKLVFLTPDTSRLRYSAIHTDDVVRMNVAVSQTTNEMLVVHYSGCWEYVFVVDLDHESSQHVTLLSEYKSHYSFDKYLLVESEGRILVCTVKTLKSNDSVEVLYEYKLKSNVLTKVRDDSITISSIEHKLCEYEDINLDCYPYGVKQQTEGGSSLWFFEGDLGHLSSLTEVSFKDCKEPVIQEHIPPPFTAVTKLYAGYVGKRMISSCGERIRHCFSSRENSALMYVKDEDL